MVKKVNKKVLKASLIGLALVVVVGLAIWLIVSKQITVTFGKNQATNNGSSVCGADIVSKYNLAYDEMIHEVVTAQLADGNIEVGGPDMTKLISVANETKELDGYDQDPTCQTLLFWAAVYDNNYDAAKSTAETVRDLHEKRIFADSDIHNNTPISNWDSEIQALSPEVMEADPGAQQE